MDQRTVYDLITSISGQNNVLTVPRVFIDVTGDIESALLLSQIIYWNDKTTNKEGWIYKTYGEWEEELGLNEYKVRKAANNLKKLDFIETKLKKANGAPTLHYRIKSNNFSESILKNLKNRICKNSRIQSVNFKESLTEITTETTTKTTTLKDNIPYSEIIEYLNLIAGTNYKPSSKKNRDLIKARWNEGFTLNDFKVVIEKKTAEWQHDPEMVKYIRPSTLFGTKFEEYLNQKVAKPKKSVSKMDMIQDLYNQYSQEEKSEGDDLW